jgi:hypothetical protein
LYAAVFEAVHVSCIGTLCTLIFVMSFNKMSAYLLTYWITDSYPFL